MAMADFVKKLTTDLTAIIITDTDERRKVHQYLDTKDDVYHMSAVCKLYSQERKFFLYRCPECKKFTKVTSDMYRYGVMDNNEDEYYAITCHKCDNMFMFEPKYDDYDEEYYKAVYRNNMSICGPCIKICIDNKKESPDIEKIFISDEEFEKIIKKAKVFHIPAPHRSLKKNIGAIQNYATDKIKKYK